jgi:hypothetical protein
MANSPDARLEKFIESGFRLIVGTNREWLIANS